MQLKEIMLFAWRGHSAPRSSLQVHLEAMWPNCVARIPRVLENGIYHACERGGPHMGRCNPAPEGTCVHKMPKRLATRRMCRTTESGNPGGPRSEHGSMLHDNATIWYVFLRSSHQGLEMKAKFHLVIESKEIVNLLAQIAFHG